MDTADPDAPPRYAPPEIPIRPDWLALRREPVLEPGLPIVDAHHHLWDRPGQRYLFDELRADLRTGHNVLATVYVQCRSMYRCDGPTHMRPVGETEFANGIGAQSASNLYGRLRACAGIVAYADLSLGAAVRPVLQAHLSAAPQRLRGIRCMTAAHASPHIQPNSGKVPEHLLMSPRFREGFAELAPLGLSYDAWAFHTQLHEVLDLARAFPQTVIVVDHAGGPLGIGPYAGRRDAVYAHWHASMRALAACPNVNVKLGGLAMHFSGLDFHLLAEPPDSRQLANAWRPYVEACIELFGAGRCMFESNFSVDKGMLSYPVLWNAFKRLAAHCSAQEKAQLFAGTAHRVYRLPPQS
ncbi:amidohydrolase [Bordetella bronchiseptica]|nr:amidohydrolase [Bordetella bronchiseptica]